MDEIKSILYPTDFSDCSAAALPHAKFLAGQLGVPLHVLYVQEEEHSQANHEVLLHRLQHYLEERGARAVSGRGHLGGKPAPVWGILLKAHRRHKQRPRRAGLQGRRVRCRGPMGRCAPCFPQEGQGAPGRIAPQRAKVTPTSREGRACLDVGFLPWRQGALT